MYILHGRKRNWKQEGEYRCCQSLRNFSNSPTQSWISSFNSVLISISLISVAVRKVRKWSTLIGCLEIQNKQKSGQAIKQNPAWSTQEVPHQARLGGMTVSKNQAKQNKNSHLQIELQIKPKNLFFDFFKVNNQVTFNKKVCLKCLFVSNHLYFLKTSEIYPIITNFIILKRQMAYFAVLMLIWIIKQCLEVLYFLYKIFYFLYIQLKILKMTCVMSYSGQFSARVIT